jgi:hypothetical protein
MDSGTVKDNSSDIYDSKLFKMHLDTVSEYRYNYSDTMSEY